MPQPQRSITLSLSPDEKAALETLALEFDKTWGERPNISALIKAIAQRRILLHQPGSLPPDERPYFEARLNAIASAVEDLRAI